MTVSSVTRMWSKSTAKYSSEQLDIVENKWSLVDGYQVVGTAATEAFEVLAHVDVPKPQDRHPSGVAAFARTRDVERISPIMWVVTIGYEGYGIDAGSVDVEWTDATSSEPIDRDWYGAAIVTVNGEQIEGLTYELSDTVAVIRRRYIYINPILINDYRHAVNSDTFLGFPPGTAKLVGYSAKNKFKYGMQEELWDVTARIQFRKPYMGATAEQAWYKRWRHEGINTRSENGTFISKGVDDLGQITSKPVLLTATGQQEFNPDNALFIYTKLYDSLPYSILGLV